MKSVRLAWKPSETSRSIWPKSTNPRLIVIFSLSGTFGRSSLAGTAMLHHLPGWYMAGDGADFKAGRKHFFRLARGAASNGCGPPTAAPRAPQVKVLDRRARES